MAFWETYSYFYSLSLRNWFPYRRLLDDLNNALEIREGESILDAGCGPGLVIEKLVRENKGKGISVVGLERSKEMIKHARKRCKNFPDVKLQIADLNKDLEFPDSSFDKVVCSNTLYAFENPQAVISEFYRVLKPGASIVIANPKPNAKIEGLIRAHLRTLKTLTPFYRRIHHMFIFVLLIPVNLIVVVINKTIIGRGRSGEYYFLDKEDLQRILQKVSFKKINVSPCYADQNWLVKAKK
jgi:ubiquinone/menaquinone biosynthesis C-methylase UbiE